MISNYKEDDQQRSEARVDPAALLEVRRLVVHRLRLRERELQETVLARLRAQAPDPLGDEHAEYTTGLRNAVNAALDYMLTWIELSKANSDRTPQPLIEQARLAARSGVGIHIVLRRYMIGYAMLGEEVMHELASPDISDRGIDFRDLLGTSASLMEDIGSLLDRLTRRVSEAYRAEIATITRASARASVENGRATPATPTAEDVPSTLRSSPPSTPRKRLSRQPQRRQRQHVTSTAARARVMSAAAHTIAERGYANTSLQAVLERAAVSRETFHAHFVDLDACVIAIMETSLEHVGALAATRFAEADCWNEGMLNTLASVLCYFDRNPALAQVCLVQSMGASPAVVARREQVVGAFRALVVTRIEHEVVRPSPNAAETTLASVMALVHIHVATGKTEPLISLLGPLMGAIVERVADPEAICSEIARGDELFHAIDAGRIEWARPDRLELVTNPHGEEGELPTRLANPNAHRIRRTLRAIHDYPGSSSTQILQHAGIAHLPQLSPIMAYFLEEGLVRRESDGAGKPNAWWPTERGTHLAHIVAQQEGKIDANETHRLR